VKASTARVALPTGAGSIPPPLLVVTACAETAGDEDVELGPLELLVAALGPVLASRWASARPPTSVGKHAEPPPEPDAHGVALLAVTHPADIPVPPPDPLAQLALCPETATF
jgi:hypothetical protein